MTKYVTITVLTVCAVPGVAKTALTPAKRPVTKEIAPGTVIVLDDDDYADELVGLGAIRKADKDDTKNTHVENLTELSDDQKQAAAVEQGRLNRETEAENARRAQIAQDALDAGKTPAPKDTTKTAPKPAAAAAKPAPAAAKAAGKPAASAADAIAADAENGDAGAAGTGGNKDGTGTNAGANTNADANENAGGTDDGGLV